MGWKEGNSVVLLELNKFLLFIVILILFVCCLMLIILCCIFVCNNWVNNLSCLFLLFLICEDDKGWINFKFLVVVLICLLRCILKNK